MRSRTVLGVAGLVALVAVTALLHRAVSEPGQRDDYGGPSCGPRPLAEMLAHARSAGASTILARGELTGRTATDGRVYNEMVLRSVRTVSGPAVGSDSAGWVSSGFGPGGPLLGATGGSLWGPGGELFAFVMPPGAEDNGTAGPKLRLTPVVDDQVIFTEAGCMLVNPDGLTSRPYDGPLAEVPGSDTYDKAKPAGFTAVPVQEVLALAVT